MAGPRRALGGSLLLLGLIGAAALLGGGPLFLTALPVPSATPSASGSVAPGPSASAAAQVPADPCAAAGTAVTGFLPTDVPGALVPAGATALTRCETLLDRRSGATAAPPRTLTGDGVGSMAQLLNVLPAAAPGQTCLRIGFPTQVSLVFAFDPATRTAPLVITVDWNCSAMVTADKARSFALLDPMPIFDRLLAAQPSPSPARSPSPTPGWTWPVQPTPTPAWTWPIQPPVAPTPGWIWPTFRGNVSGT